MKLSKHELTTATNKALDAFWQVIAGLYPNAASGDLSPMTTMNLDQAAESAIKEWVTYNVPPCHINVD